jgi:hypothetical protein
MIICFKLQPAPMLDADIAGLGHLTLVVHDLGEVVQGENVQVALDGVTSQGWEEYQLTAEARFLTVD